jgi:hypothetical protein
MAAQNLLQGLFLCVGVDDVSGISEEKPKNFGKKCEKHFPNSNFSEYFFQALIAVSDRGCTYLGSLGDTASNLLQ